jgi:hypothetical protein
MSFSTFVLAAVFLVVFFFLPALGAPTNTGSFVHTECVQFFLLFSRLDDTHPALMLLLARTIKYRGEEEPVRDILPWDEAHAYWFPTKHLIHWFVRLNFIVP